MQNEVSKKHCISLNQLAYHYEPPSYQPGEKFDFSDFGESIFQGELCKGPGADVVTY